MLPNKYDNAGNRTRLTLPNGISTDYSYDVLNRLTSLVAHKGTQGPLASFTYTFDPAGNRLGVVEGDRRSIKWSYDRANRLTGETRYDASGAATSRTSYSYDHVGNRLSMTRNGDTTTYTYNALDQLLTAGSTQYSYDGRGNVIKITDGSDVTSYRYDVADRMAGVALPNGTSASYGYNADGRRISQTVGGTVTNYLWDEVSRYGNVALETNASGALQASYVLGNGQILSQNRGGTANYYLYDGQGSTRALADAGGSITDRYSYDAYGNLLSHQGTTANPYLYTGQQFDALAGLYDLRARYYNPADGRFLSRDTAGFDPTDPTNLHPYLYTAADPINASDPSGYQEEAEEAGILSRLANALATAFKARLTLIVGKALAGAALGLACQLTLGSSVAAIVACSVLLSGGRLAGAAAGIAGAAIGSACQLVLGNSVADIAVCTVLSIAATTSAYRGARGPIRLARSGRGAAEASAEEGAAADTAASRAPREPDIVGCARCFPAGTLVAMPRGLRPIQTLHVGDKVLAEDPKTHKVEAEPLQAVRHDPAAPLMAIDLSDGSTITATLTHAFWVDAGDGLAHAGWFYAKHLRVGDQLRTADGTHVVVVGLRYNVGQADVYTLTVAHDHTFFVGSARVLVHNAAGSCEFIDPDNVRFSQRSIKYEFSQGGNIDELAEGLRTGRIRPEDVPPIRLVERDGRLYTLDNRRLEAFRRAGVKVPYRMATPEEIAREGWKFTTRNDGTSIKVRGQP